MNRVVLTGRLTRDPEMRSLASGKTVTTFTVASNEFLGGGKEKAEYQVNTTVYPRTAAGDASFLANAAAACEWNGSLYDASCSDQKRA